MLGSKRRFDLKFVLDIFQIILSDDLSFFAQPKLNASEKMVVNLGLPIGNFLLKLTLGWQKNIISGKYDFVWTKVTNHYSI